MTLSKTVVLWSKLKDWKTNPISSLRKEANSLSSNLETSLPLKINFPPEALSSKPKICIKVDFPDPEGPIMATNSPFSITKDVSFKA